MTMTLVGTPGVLPVANLKSLDNWRAFLHQVVMVVAPVLVTLNVVGEAEAASWVVFVLAIVDNVLSAGNATDRVRRAIYAGAGALQAGGLLTTLLTDFAPTYVDVGSASLAVLTAFLARFYTPTTTIAPVETIPGTQMTAPQPGTLNVPMLPEIPPPPRRRLP